MKRFLPYLKPYVKEIIAAPLFKMTEALFELLVPLVIGSIIDTGIAGGDTAYIIRRCLILGVLALAGLSFSVTAQFFSAKAAIGFAGRLRSDMFRRIMSLSYSQYDTNGLSTLITRMTTDVNTLQSGVNLVLRLLLRSPFVVFGAVIMAFTVDVESALVFAVALPVLTAAIFGILLPTIPMYKKVRERLDDVTLAVRRALGGIRVIRAFGKESEYTEDFGKRTDALYKENMKASGVSALLAPVTYVLINIATVVLIYTGAVRVNNGSLSQGNVVVLYNYMAQIIVELIKLANLIILLTKSVASGKRVAAVLEQTPEITYPETGAEPDFSKPAVEFDKVTFTYPAADASSLENVSFSIGKGSSFGITGATGSGKSTLINLIPRFYDAQQGEIKIFGNPVGAYTPEMLGRLVSVVPQKAELFTGTIRENLTLGLEGITDDELHSALKTAQASDVVASREKGLDDVLEEGGKNLSGGQKQRLTVARALVRKTPVLILDDSSSALDTRTDFALRDAISKLDYKPAVIIVSQRISAVKDCDTVAVTDDGNLTATGTHDELLQKSELYRELYSSQTREAEV